MQILRSSEYRRMKWKNGAGETRELLVSPNASSMDDFDWRISVADVMADSGFSDFGPVDRTLCVLKGNGIDLVFGYDLQVTLTCASKPFTFDGHARVHGRMLNGPITDLNVMTRRGRFVHSVTRVNVAESHNAFAGADHLLVFAETPLQLKNGLFRLEAHDAVLLEPGEASVSIEGVDGRASVILVRLSKFGKRPAF